MGDDWFDDIKILISEWSLQTNGVDLELSNSQLNTIYDIIAYYIIGPGK